MKKLLSLGLFALLTVAALSQSPQKLTYQAILRNAQGNQEVLADKIYCNRANRASLKLPGIKLRAKPPGRPKTVDVEHVRPGRKKSNRWQVWTSQDSLRVKPDQGKTVTNKRIMDCHVHPCSQPGQIGRGGNILPDFIGDNFFSKMSVGILPEEFPSWRFPDKSRTKTLMT